MLENKTKSINLVPNYRINRAIHVRFTMATKGHGRKTTKCSKNNKTNTHTYTQLPKPEAENKIRRRPNSKYDN